MRKQNEVPPESMANGIQGIHCIFVTLGRVVGRWSNVVLLHTIR